MPKMETENVKTQNHRGADQQCAEEQCVDLKQVTDAALTSFREYARSNPETVALWCVGIGFVLGWKLKPW